MTVGELIKELEKYDEKQRVMLYSHGRCYVTQRKKQRKKHINIYQNYAKAYIQIAVPTATKLRTYIA